MGVAGAEANAAKRPRKPTPERTGPVRSWSATGADAGAPASTTGPPPTPAAASASDGDATTPPDAGAGEGSTRAPAGSPEGAVDAGYRVIDDYLSQGRAAAEQLGFGLAGGLATAGSFQGLTARLFQDGLVWLEHLSKLAGGFDGASGEGAGSTGEETLVRVSSKAPAQVDLRLSPGAKSQGLAVHPLHCAGSDARDLDDIQLDRHEGRLRLSVFVPDAQPAGLYTGVVVDRSDGSIQGTLSVRIDEGGGA